MESEDELSAVEKLNGQINPREARLRSLAILDG